MKKFLIGSALLPAAALAVFLFGAPEPLMAADCEAGQCVYASQCYSEGACLNGQLCHNGNWLDKQQSQAACSDQ